MYDQSFMVKIIVLLLVGASIGWLLFNRLGDIKYKRFKQYGPVAVSVINIFILLVAFSSRRLFIFLEFYLIGGAGVIAGLCAIWSFKEKEVKFKKTSYIFKWTIYNSIHSILVLCICFREGVEYIDCSWYLTLHDYLIRERF